MPQASRRSRSSSTRFSGLGSTSPKAPIQKRSRTPRWSRPRRTQAVSTAISSPYPRRKPWRGSVTLANPAMKAPLPLA